MGIPLRFCERIEFLKTRGGACGGIYPVFKSLGHIGNFRQLFCRHKSQTGKHCGLQTRNICRCPLCGNFSREYFIRASGHQAGHILTVFEHAPYQRSTGTVCADHIAVMPRSLPEHRQRFNGGTGQRERSYIFNRQSVVGI